ncbi:MAG: hypothetical protein HWE24_18330 [Oceanospirillaceae bacterium]|nr:hypothetical protein [Oceanospirillaceae bacterium]
MDLSTEDLALINAFQQELEIFKDYDSVDANIATYQAFSHFDKSIDTLARGSYPYRSEHNNVQYELRSKLKYSVKEFLESNRLDARDFLDNLLDKIPVLKLIGYPFHLVRSAHNGYFLPRYQQELIILAQSGQSHNRNPLDNTLYITYPTFFDIAEGIKLAHDILLLFISDQWDVGFRAAAAKPLSLLGSTDSQVRIWKALKDNELDDPILNCDEANAYLMLWIEHCVRTSGGSKNTKELVQLETLLWKKRRLNPHSELAKFSANKWQHSSWKRKVIDCNNGWRFTLHRSPYLAHCQLEIPGGEVARDQVVPSDPEQLKWLEQTLTRLAPDAYNVCWVIQYKLYGESILQALLNEINNLGVKNEDDEPTEHYIVNI